MRTFCRDKLSNNRWTASSIFLKLYFCYNKRILENIATVCANCSTQLWIFIDISTITILANGTWHGCHSLKNGKCKVVSAVLDFIRIAFIYFKLTFYISNWTVQYCRKYCKNTYLISLNYVINLLSPLTIRFPINNLLLLAKTNAVRHKTNEFSYITR